MTKLKDLTMREKILIDDYTNHCFGDLSPQYDVLKDFFNKNLEKFESVFGRKIEFIIVRGRHSGDVNKAHFYQMMFNFRTMSPVDRQFLLEGSFTDEIIKDPDALFSYLKSRIQKTANES